MTLNNRRLPHYKAFYWLGEINCVWNSFTSFILLLNEFYMFLDRMFTVWRQFLNVAEKPVTIWSKRADTEFFADILDVEKSPDWSNFSISCTFIMMYDFTSSPLVSHLCHWLYNRVLIFPFIQKYWPVKWFWSETQLKKYPSTCHAQGPGYQMIPYLITKCGYYFLLHYRRCTPFSLYHLW